MDHVAGKVLIVTGGAGGFGRILCDKAAARGAKIVCADIDADGLKAVDAAMVEAGAECITVRADVTSMEDMTALAAAAVERFGRIDVMVNNAGIMPLAFYRDHASALPAWEKCIDINIKGVMHGIVAVHDQMMAQGEGHVINLSSIYSNHPVAGAAVYGTSKAAVHFPSEALSVESQGRIRVTNVRPTGVPGTNLGAGVINPEAIVGILGQNAPAYLQQMGAHAAGELPDAQLDVGNIEYYALDPEHLSQQILYAIDQPLGISISDITVRASGDGYIL